MYGRPIERAIESFQQTRPSARVICRRGRRVCSLRVDRASQVRNVRYSDANRFGNREQYLTQADLAAIRY